MAMKIIDFVFKFRNLKFWCYAIDIYFINFKAKLGSGCVKHFRAQ